MIPQRSSSRADKLPLFMNLLIAETDDSSSALMPFTNTPLLLCSVAITPATSITGTEEITVDDSWII